MNKKKKSKAFWIVYAIYTVLLAAVLCFGISLLWKFLSVYEQTRPVHAMEHTLSILEREQEETLRSYLTNNLDTPYESSSDILSSFYDMLEGQELTFGKLSGSYSELHPVYAVLAGETHVATLSFTMDDKIVDYNLSGWKLEAVTLLISPKYSFALTVPSSMKVFVNQVPIAEDAVLSTTATDTPVSYVDYSVTGLYLEPKLEVFDRYGAPVTLQVDEETGGYYYRLAYASAPATMQLCFGERVLGEDNLREGNISIPELDFIDSLAKRFPEYAVLPEVLTLPTINKYYIDFAYDTDSILWKNRFGEVVIPDYDKVRNSYSFGLVSDETVREEAVSFVQSFIEQYALFCANDAEAEALADFFPADSEFYKLVKKMDNRWYNAHSNLTFQNHELKEYFAYCDNLAYVHITMEQRMLVRALGKYQVYNIDLPVWIVKLDGTWYIARIIFDNFSNQ